MILRNGEVSLLLIFLTLVVLSVSVPDKNVNRHYRLFFLLRMVRISSTALMLPLSIALY